MNILITGSNGFIGSYFINKYAKKYSVKRFSFSNDSISELVLDNISTIIHLSALVHQMGEVEDTEYRKVNVAQTIDLARQAKESGVKHFIFMSSIAVYSKREIIYENTQCKPITAYGKSKREAEEQLEALQDENFIISIIRPPMVYGENAPGNIDSLTKIIKKLPILPFSKIKNKRSFVYIGNLCFLVDTVIQKRQKGIFLAADERAISTTEFIKLIAKSLHKKIYLIEIPFFETLLRLLKPSIHRRLYGSLEVDNRQTMTTLFGDTKEVLPYSVEEGIRLMIRGEKK